MTKKREEARKALEKWKSETTPEMFIKQHEGIGFAKTNKTVKVELKYDSINK